MLLQQEGVANLVRLLRSEVHANVVADLEPVAGKAEVGPLGELQAEDILVELLRALEVLRHKQVMIQFGEWHGVLQMRKMGSVPFLFSYSTLAANPLATLAYFSRSA